MNTRAAVTFTVNGQPVPQPRPKVSTVGGFGRAYVPTRHPIHAYRQAVALTAKASGVTPADGAVVVQIDCVFARPPSHLNKAGVPRSSAPPFPPKCDWDNLGKGVCDALVGIAFHDDEQIIDGRCTKRYAAKGEPAGTRVTIAPADPEGRTCPPA